MQCKDSSIRGYIQKIWTKNRFLTTFNQFYKTANLLHREATRGKIWN